MAADLVDTLINTGGGAGGGGLFGFLVAKYLGNKSDKEIEDIKKELQNNKDADSIRDTAIQLLKLEVENSKQTSGKLEAQLSKMEEKFEKKLDAIFDRLNQSK